MAVTSRTKRASRRRSVVLTKGDWLDVMDQDGVWNVARVLSVPSPEEVEVMYDGWPEEYDEVVRVDSDRVAPYHTFTWAVKCWVKYLNWPLWPSVITIRTPGTLDGIKNLSLENRLYVDFLEDPTFANRDRCWQKKRQVKILDSNFDKNRKQTNGAQFELALGSVLQSDATTKMPTFARGTLPLQYENSTTESVERMRKIMGNRLWYRNFDNNKERHMKTHKYETIGDEDEESSSDESVPKLKVRRPKTSPAHEEQDPSPQKKKKRPFPAKEQPAVVKVEQEPLARIGLGDMDSSDDQKSEGERNAALTKKRRLRAKRRSTVSPVARKEMPSKKGKRLSSPGDTNAASSMPRHVTVMMDEIIVDDDEDSGDDEVGRRKVARNTGRSPRKPAAGKTSTHVKEDSVGTDDLLTEATDAAESSRKFRSKAKTTSPVRQRVQRRKTEKPATHRKTWNGNYSEPAEPATERSNRKGSFLSLSGQDSDDDMYFDGFDPDTTSEDKAASPCDSHFNPLDNITTSLPGIKPKSADRSKGKVGNRATPSDAVVTPRSTKAKSKGQIKMAARRSVPPLQEDLSLTASPKRRSSIRSPRSLSDEDDWEDEEKGVLRDETKEVELHEKTPKTSVIRRQSKQSGESKQDSGSSGVTDPQKTSQNKPSMRPKTPLPLIEQRIAFAKEELQNLDKKKNEVSKDIAPKKRQKRSSSSSLSGSHNGSQASVSKVKPSRSYQPESLDVSFLRVDDKENGSPIVSRMARDRPGRLTETSLNLDFPSNQLDHSFLSVDQKADNSDCQEESPTLFDEDMALDFQSDPKEAMGVTKAEAKSLPEVEIVASVNQRDEDTSIDDDDGEEKAQEVPRRFCVMQAGLEGTLDVEDDENAKPRNAKKTVISVPRKFDGVTKGAAYDFTSSTAGSPSSPTAIFSSSKGFSMEKWVKTINGRSSKT
ncbi:hypothetical protein PC129_g4932 [Phytophthora cactorum]|uniref:PWWP domain-containing protein n=1 Tax=Phytophthora cactorum TaxID=29920 RepID=A0A329SFF0_9STRA|nr:hypothetical protein Pcac1_g1805 [Phytophthora cactorum]KAG2831871.1 hypothetical protein PC112_g7134 [Phytophthora cactorum]KAG2834291.1 hypothetical protein PC111_g5893 [Phytophthora cactorum]KAG2861725.1 hypothetical protein PC113_g6937 [Phytophthora cactorum]KAG2910270.1 hypothetical protein PC114_g9825 [Phytophthora cactorum]